MNKPIILANENLVLNGDFEQWIDHWIQEPASGYLGTASDWYEEEGQHVRFLTAGNGASVNQALTAPKDPGAQARYVLTFLCETRHTEPGRLLISSDKQPQEQEILLPPGPARDAQEDQARRRDGPPREYRPIPYNVPLDLPFNAQDILTVSIHSPRNVPGDVFSDVRITRINLQLHLEPALMQALKLDEQTRPATGRLYVCLGASGDLAHQLEFVPDPGNAWVGTQAALTSDDNPQEALMATPAWGVDHPLDSAWTLDCPAIGEDGPYSFSMDLVNQYAAEVYPVQVSLGHHRLAFREVLEAAYYPVLEYDQSVRLGVQVTSYYTGQPLSDRTVNWTSTTGQVASVAITRTDGWAYFDFQPAQAGDVEIQASVESLYYASGVLTQTLMVRVLATDPWKDVRTVVEGVESPWEEKTGYPNRGSDYPLDVKLPAASPLQGTQLSLHWSGDSHEQLGVVVNPALEAAVPVTGAELVWTLTSEDRYDGRFELQLACSKLLLPSPKKTMSLARNLVRVGNVREANKFPVVDENESVLLRVQVVHFVASGDGDPVINAQVEWKAGAESISTVTTGAGGWASVLYTPQSAGDKVVIASIKAHEQAVAVEQPFDVTAIATSPWKSEVSILVDGEVVQRNTLGVLCRRGQTHTLKVVPNAGSLWIDKNISLHWRGAAPDIGLLPSDLGTPKRLEAAGAQWTLASQVNNSTSSLFELELRLESVSVVRELTGRLVSEDLAEEVSLRLDQIAAALDAQALYPCLGALHRFSVLPNALSPLVGLESTLAWSGTPAEELGATVRPVLNLAQPINDGGAIWMLDFTASEQPGEFALAWAVPALDFVATAKPMTLAHNKVRIQGWRESPVDPVVGQDPAWLWVQVVSHFTGLAVSQVPVTWTAGRSSAQPTDAEGWSGFPMAPAAAGTQAVKASVSSRYDGYEEERPFEVTALATDPWAGLTVSFDGAAAQPWGEKTYFPRRKGEHVFELMAPENSPLFERELTLGMTGTGPSELGISFLPDPLGMPREFPSDGLRFTLKAGDLKDGGFALRLASQRLASLSPANAMSLGEGEQVLEIRWDSGVHQTLDWEQELVEQVAVVSSISGKPIAGVTVIWRGDDLGEVTTVTDYYGVARVRYVPTTPGAAQLTATVGQGQYASSVALSYFLHEPREIQSLISDKPNGHLGELVSAVVTVVSAMTGEPLEDVEVRWEYPQITIAATRTNVDGQAEVQFRLPGVRKGVLYAIVTGGYAGWEMAALSFELLPNDMTWLQDFRPYVDGRPVEWSEVKLNVFAGQVCTLKLDYGGSWLIGEPDAQICLQFKPGEEVQGLVFDPPLGQLVAMEQGGTSLSWTIFTDQAQNRPFVLEFDIPLITEMPPSPPLSGITRDEDSWLEEFTFYLNSQEFDLAHRRLSLKDGTNNTWELRAKEDSALINATSVALWMSGGDALQLVFDPPLFQPQPVTTVPLSWSILTKASHWGSFTLELRSPDLPSRSIDAEVNVHGT
ncbi:Ig-like domain-containing protein [Pseudomonas brassicacearum]|uniref:Ig-like domain-containing protein n=1 Tax=Pseudomonas brassicacearum TaxID=930166 RepID=UPI003ECC834B